MKPYNPLTAAKTVKAFIFGDPGAGKTTFLGTAMYDARTSPLLLIDCGGNPESLRRNARHPYVIAIETSKELGAIYSWLAAGQPREKHPFLELLKKNNFPPLPEEKFKSVAIDVITEVQRIVVDEITGNDSKMPGDSFKSAETRDWGTALTQVTKAARLFFKLDLTVFIICWEKAKENNGITRIVPSLWGQAQNEVPGYSLLTMRFVREAKLGFKEKKEVTKEEIAQAHTFAYCDQISDLLVKEQYGGLPPVIADPTVTKLLNYIYGEETSAVIAA